MTTHADYRTALTDRMPIDSPTTATPTASPKRPLPRWVAPVGIAASVFVAGIGIVAFRSDNQPTPAPAATEESVIGSGQVLQPGMPDGYWLSESPTPIVNATVGESTIVRTGQLVQPGRPDGHFQPATASSPTVDDIGNGRILRPGVPDGYRQPTEDAATADPVTNSECKVAQPC